MSIEKDGMIAAPFYRVGRSPVRMNIEVLAALAVLAGLYSLLYDHAYFLRWIGYVLAGLVLEAVYIFLADGKLRLRSGGSAVTAAILVMSIPADMAPRAVLYALTLAVVLGRMPSGRHAVRFNPVLLGRLFLMIAFSTQIVDWKLPGIDTDAVTTATPIDLFHTEDFIYSVRQLLSGHIGGNWEDMYAVVPGGPGEMFTPVIILLGLLLYRRGILAGWRTGAAFIAAFAATCAAIGAPVLFNVSAGAVVFAAVFIAGDPKSTPASRSGQLIGGIIAGIANALIRKYTYYSEGIVFSFLLLNLISPTLDRLAFQAQGLRLARQAKKFLR